MKKNKPKNLQRLRREIADLQATNGMLRDALSKMRPMYASKVYCARIGDVLIPLMASSVHIRGIASPIEADHLTIIDIEARAEVGKFDFGKMTTFTPGESYDIHIDMVKAAMGSRAPEPKELVPATEGVSE